MDSPRAPASPVGRALAAVSAAVDELVAAVEAGGLAALEPVGLVEFLRDFERLRNRLPVVDHEALRVAADQDLAGVLGHGRLSRVLVHTLRLSAGEANRRLRAATQLGRRSSPLGEPLPARRPALADAVRSGGISPEQTDLILRGLATVDRPGYDPADLDHGETVLTELAATFGPRDLQVCLTRFLDHLDPDGTRPDDQLVADRRHLQLRPQPDGSWRGEFRLTATLGAKLHAILAPLARPRPAPPDGPGQTASAGPADPRSPGQRWHDALDDVCDRTLRAGDLPDSGGIPTTLIVTLDADNLRTRTGTATTSDGTPLTIPQLLQLANEAEIIPTVLNRSGAVLTLGRSRRIASRSQTLALAARDHGCSFPGCSHPPAWCERHHIRPWIDGGRTDLDNLTLLCRYHHHHFANHGWTCRLNADRLPEWIPPPHLDPTQTPLVNTRIQAALTGYTRAA